MGTHPIFESDFDCLTDLGLCNEMVTQKRKKSSAGRKKSSGNLSHVRNPTLEENGNHVEKRYKEVPKKPVIEIAEDVKNVKDVKEAKDVKEDDMDGWEAAPVKG